MLNFLLYYVMLHVDAGGNPARHCHLGPGRHLYAVFVLICLACFMKCIFLCCMLFYCFNIDVSVFIFGKKLCRAYVIMLYTCRIKIKFSYLILSYLHMSITLWAHFSSVTRCTRYNLIWYKVCQWLQVDLWFCTGTRLSSTNEADRHDITIILSSVTLNTNSHYQ